MSAQVVNGSLSAGVQLKTALSGTAGAAVSALNLGQLPIAITSGTGIGQCNEEWSETINLTASTPVDLDLTNLVGEGGRAVNFAALKVLAVYLADGTAGHDVAIGGNGPTNALLAPFNGSTTALKAYAATLTGSTSSAVPPVPFLLVNLTAAGWTVDGTHKVIRIDPGSNNVTGVTICLAGLSV